MLAYLREGSGSPVVYLHGFLESSVIWEQINLDGFEKITIDLPGHGSSKEVSCISIAEMAAILLQTLNSLSLGKYDLVGHSMGGYAALELVKIDSNCNRVVLLNSNFWEDSPQKKLDRQRVAKLVKSRKDHFIIEAIPNLFMDPEKHDSLIKNLIADAKKMSPANIGDASFAIMNREDNSEFADSLGDKLLIIQGKHDQIVPLELMRERTSGMRCEVCELESAHMSLFETTDETKRCLAEFLSKENGN